MSGNELHSLLKFYNVNFKELAEKLGLKQQTLNQRFKSKAIKLDFLTQIQDALGFELNVPVTSTVPTNSQSNDHVGVLIGLLQQNLEELRKQLESKEREIAEYKDKLGKMEIKYDDLNRRYQELLSAVEYKKQAAG